MQKLHRLHQYISPIVHWKTSWYCCCLAFKILKLLYFTHECIWKKTTCTAVMEALLLKKKYKYISVNMKDRFFLFCNKCLRKITKSVQTCTWNEGRLWSIYRLWKHRNLSFNDSSLHYFITKLFLFKKFIYNLLVKRCLASTLFTRQLVYVLSILTCVFVTVQYCFFPFLGIFKD